MKSSPWDPQKTKGREKALMFEVVELLLDAKVGTPGSSGFPDRFSQIFGEMSNLAGCLAG